MATQQQIKQFQSKMTPYAQSAGAMLNMPWHVILSQWGLESEYGTSHLATSANNFGGIKYTSHADFKTGPYSGYNSINNFVKDYERVMGLSYYNNVRSAVGDAATAKALGDSKYAGDKSYGTKVLGVVKTLFGQADNSSNETTGSTKDVNSMSTNELKTYAGLAVGIIALIGASNLSK